MANKKLKNKISKKKAVKTTKKAAVKSKAIKTKGGGKVKTKIKSGDGLKQQHDFLFPTGKRKQADKKEIDRDYLGALAPGGKILKASKSADLKYKKATEAEEDWMDEIDTRVRKRVSAAAAEAGLPPMSLVPINADLSLQMVICKGPDCMSCHNRADGTYDPRTGANEIYCALEMRDGMMVAEDQSMKCPMYDMLPKSATPPGTVQVGYGKGLPSNSKPGQDDEPSKSVVEQYVFTGKSLIRVDKPIEGLETLPLTVGFVEFYNILVEGVINDAERAITNIREALTVQLEQAKQSVMHNPEAAVEIGAAVVLGVVTNGEDDDEEDGDEDEGEVEEIIDIDDGTWDEEEDDEDWDDEEDEEDDEP